MARNCWFCGATGSLTAEHLFPDWLAEVIPGQAGAPYDVAEEFKTEGSDRESRSWGSSSPVSEVVRVVCGPCNNGWMSELEGAAKPILTPLVQGRTASLDFDEQITAATWATKTAMVAEARGGEMQVLTTDADRRLVMDERRPPADTRVRLFRYRGEALTLLRKHVAAVGPRGTTETQQRPNVAVTTLLIGHLGLQILTDRSDLAQSVGEPGAASTSVMTVWPPSQSAVSWPPRDVVADGGLAELHTAVFPEARYWMDGSDV